MQTRTLNVYLLTAITNEIKPFVSIRHSLNIFEQYNAHSRFSLNGRCPCLRTHLMEIARLFSGFSFAHKLDRFLSHFLQI